MVQLRERYRGRDIVGDWNHLRSCDAAVHTALADQDFRRALDLLVCGYQDIVIGFCCNMLGNREMGAEVAQKALLAAYEAMPAYRQEASIRTWLFAIVRRLCLKESQQTHRRTWILRHHIQAIRSTLHRPPVASMEAQYLDGENRQFQAQVIERFPQYLARLDYGERDMLMLYYYVGSSYAEIAATLRTSVSTVRRRMTRALEHLKAVIIQDLGDGDANKTKLT
jgi:RNA polymerase sigma-70 factor (ECF subfamily)